MIINYIIGIESDELEVKRGGYPYLEESELEFGTIEDLLDIAKALYDEDLKQAKSLFNRLPESHKKQVQNHLFILNKVAFEDRFATIQALIATVNDLVRNNETYPTSEEIEDLFIGLKEIREEATIIPFHLNSK